MSKLLVITTGGTIAQEHDELGTGVSNVKGEDEKSKKFAKLLTRLVEKENFGIANERATGIIIEINKMSPWDASFFAGQYYHQTRNLPPRFTKRNRRTGRSRLPHGIGY